MKISIVFLTLGFIILAFIAYKMFMEFLEDEYILSKRANDQYNDELCKGIGLDKE